MFKIRNEVNGRVGWENKLGLFLLSISTLQLSLSFSFEEKFFSSCNDFFAMASLTPKAQGLKLEEPQDNVGLHEAFLWDGLESTSQKG